MDSQQSSTGFSPHLLNQLDQASQQVSQSQRGHGRGRRFGRGREHSRHYHNVAPTAHPFQGPLSSIDFFPPLGSQPSPSHAATQLPPVSVQQPFAQPPPTPYQDHQRGAPPREFFDRTRGAHRGRPPWSHQFQPGAPSRQYQPQSDDDFRRPPAPHGTLYQQSPFPDPNMWPHSSDQQQVFRHQVMAQADYLNRMQQEARNKYQLKQDEQVTKETFRRRLESFFQDVLSQYSPGFDPHGVRLKCYGSLNNGFGLAGCDMDLLLALPEGFSPQTLTSPPFSEQKTEPAGNTEKTPGQSEDASAAEDIPEPSQKENVEVGWLLEGALLDAGIGARLLTKTRVPILKICESPSPELLQNLRQYHIDQAKTDTPLNAAPAVSESTLPPSLDLRTLDVALSDLEDQDSAAKVSLPSSPPKRAAATLEFDGNFGIKCDVNFSNSVAVHNTHLLRQYCLIDPRVAQVGVFVKTWAKTRDINTPYYGTLSSYGYVLMVLHFLMNVVHPPVIPNLQYAAHDEDAWNEQADIELFEGKYDIRFLTNKKKIDSLRSGLGHNRESTGSLIRGFFWYYSNRDGFNWKNEVISIRTKGGILKKFSKGWTEAKWGENTDKKNVRLRYLMAIEDPFETDHNVARVVGHHGIVAIRDEFRRAWSIISSIDGEGGLAEDLMKPMETRGDLLRKDQDHHKEKMRQVRQALEVKERESREASLKDNSHGQENGTSSDNDSPSSVPLRAVPRNRRSSNSKLTPRVGTFQDKRKQASRRIRKVQEDSDGEDDDGENGSGDRSKSSDNPTGAGEKAGNAIEIDEDPEPFCSAADINASRGFDAWGKPIAWDLSAQDGRWLQWRDNKIRQGTWRGASRPDLAVLDEECPYDWRRPKGEAPPLSVNPPYPLNKYGETSGSQNPYVKAAIRDTERVKLPIGWNRWSAGGLWLRKRDAMIRSRKLDVSALDDWQKHLHVRFPYSPEMLKSQLREYNHELRDHWKSKPEKAMSKISSETTLEPPAKETEHVTVVAETTRDTEPITTVETEYREAPKPPEDGQHSLQKDTTCPHLPTKQSELVETEIRLPDQAADKQEASNKAMPSAAFIRSRRLAYFAQQQELEDSGEDGGPDTKEVTVKTLMKEAGIDIHLPELTKHHSAIGVWARSDSEDESYNNKAVQPTKQISLQPLTDEESQSHGSVASVRHDKVPEAAESAEGVNHDRVPSTRFPDLTREQRPRDEDPNIMPIPRTYGFRFDIRQLRDLAVIKEGGNGCARAGQEFEIEDDYEWGGGGEMGYKSTSGVRQSSGDDGLDAMYEYGRGDEDGLLNELPLGIDE